MLGIEVPDEAWELISYVMGCSSVMIWLCAQLPQILKNWRRQSVEGLSPGFLVAWVAGDASNLAGCLLTHQLGVQILLASYYCLVDVVLITQYVMYKPRLEVIEGIGPTTLSHDIFGDENDNTNHEGHVRSKSKLELFTSKVALLMGVSQVGQANGYPINTSVASASVDNSVATGRLVAGSTDVALSSVQETLGFVVAYFSTGMYLFSRLPQIAHNFQRKSTTGVSMMLFSSAFLGNLTYTLSIVLAPQSMGKGADQKAFLLHELSYILGAAGTMLFDCIILAQWWFYRRKGRAMRRRSTQPLDRIQRPYLGTPREIRLAANGSGHREYTGPVQWDMLEQREYVPARPRSKSQRERQPLLPAIIYEEEVIRD